MQKKYLPVAAVMALALATATSAAPERPRSHRKPVAARAPSLATFERLLDRRNAEEAGGLDTRMAATDREIRADFEKPLAILITDMTGFTRRTRTRGIISFLGQVRRMKQLAEPILAKHGAQLVKMEADDLFVAHADPRALLAVARDLQAAVRAHNAAHKDDIGLSVGLGYGPTLVIGNDVFGNSVNTASKLGEDTGKVGDILASGDFVTATGGTNACAPVAANEDLPFSYFSCR